MSAATLLLAGAVVFIGALLQGSIGYGMNLLAAPLLALVNPDFVPIPLLFITSAHALLAVVRERHETDWRGVGWMMTGRIPGTAIGVLAISAIATRPFSAIIGGCVLVCVALSMTSWRPVPDRNSLMFAGVASGTFATAAAIGGPPIAVLYQHDAGPRIRSTMAACFALGSLISVGGLALGGEMEYQHLGLAGSLVPFLAVGFVVSGLARKYLDGGRIRQAVLGIAALSAVALIIRSVVG